MKVLLLCLLLTMAVSQQAVAGGRDSFAFSFRLPDEQALSLHLHAKTDMWAPVIVPAKPAWEVQNTPESRRRSTARGLIVGGLLFAGVGTALLLAGKRESDANQPNIGLKGLGKQLGGVVLGCGGIVMSLSGLTYAYKLRHPVTAQD